MKIARLCVVDKALRPSSGDVHDYVSSGPYWWPDLERADGLPYVRRDGEVNPASAGDRTALESFQSAVTTLILLSELDGSLSASRQSARLLRGWFLDPETKMKPHLRFAQGIPGLCEGRGIGLIDTWGLCFLVDAISHLEFGDIWTEQCLAEVRAWFSSYLDWMLESPEGKQECAESNNHGTWYDAQIVCFATFCGRDEIAERQIEQFTRDRIGNQIQADGSQPHELARTLSQTYCTFNLLGFACLARAGRRLDLWSWTSPNGGQLSKAVRWMLPYFFGEHRWEWPQITPFVSARAALLLNLAAEGTGDPAFADASLRLSAHPWERISPWKLYRTL